MKHFTRYLTEDLGFKTYKLVSKNNWNKEAKKQAEKILQGNIDGIIFKTGDLNSEESEFYIPVNFNSIYITANYNVMNNGGIHTYFIKDYDIKNVICYGLNEVGKPPTLIFPRPKINLKIDTSKYDGIFIRNSICEVFDDAMNGCLKNESPELIYKALFDNSIIFNYD